MTLQLPSVRLQALLDRLVTRRGIHHAVLAIETIDGSARWVGAAGSADRLDTPMRPETPYFIASVDKLYTAAAILKLHEQGRIALDRPAAAYLPAELMRGIHAFGAVDCSARITVRDDLTPYFPPQDCGAKRDATYLLHRRVATCGADPLRRSDRFLR